MEPSVTTNNDKPLMSQGGEGGLEASDSLSLEKLESNQVIMMDWSLVHAFAAVHGLKPSNKLLEQLAKCDDWILFLAEAGVHEYSREEVRSLIFDHTSPNSFYSLDQIFLRSQKDKGFWCSLIGCGNCANQVL